MSTTTANETVHDRIAVAKETMTLGQMAAVTAFAAAIAFALIFVQEPLVHDSMHNFRHAAGITCH
ncbi:CbtB domain-containing protein [Natronobacterium texcoconense]|uniref:Probable cobalt transporter subunit (CbtB) n=1 Tax=Natronobacterium texcoconense TaxID=1095778 RepID=A0A1H1IG58_NATTX|nr:CbtB domain-containing protein [Natronobacterium texcoconense]SDR36306.1 Probable cobalt transporter subunit (CbtB) [Natronobacterium texcoconense]